MKDRCIDDVAIRYSFVSRNYRKELKLCATIFCSSEFDIAHDLVQAIGNDTAEKWVHMLRFPSHLSVQGSADISWRGFFRPENKLFSSKGGLPTEEAMTRSTRAITGATNFVAMLRLLNFSYKIHTCYHNTSWRMRFERNFPKNGYLNCFGLGLPCEIKTSYGNFKNAAILPR